MKKFSDKGKTMLTEEDFKLRKLEEAKRMYPLKSFSLKKENVLWQEAILMYYGIQFDIQKMSYIEQFINEIDQFGIYDVFLSSDFFIKSPQNSFKLMDFVNWLKEKDFEIPEHLEIIVESSKLTIKTEEENDTPSNSNKSPLHSCKFSVLVQELSIRLAKTLSKEPSYKGRPSTEIIHFAKFIEFRKTVKFIKSGKDFVDDTYQRWISPHLSKKNN